MTRQRGFSDRLAALMTLWASAPYTADPRRVRQTFEYKVTLSASSNHISACQSSATTRRSSRTQKPLAGTIASGFYNTESNAGYTQFQKDLDAVKSGTKPSLGNAAGYFGADMFISALKKVAKKGTSNITPENVQKAGAAQTWQIKGFVGPTVYPKATVVSTPSCSSLVENADGSAWKTVQPYACSFKTFKIDPKFKG